MQSNVNTNTSIFAAASAAPKTILNTIATTASLVEDIVNDVASNREAVTESIRDIGRSLDLGVLAITNGVRYGVSEALGRQMTDQEWTTSSGRRTVMKEIFRYKPEEHQELPGKEVVAKIEEPEEEGYEIKLSPLLKSKNSMTF